MRRRILPTLLVSALILLGSPASATESPDTICKKAAGSKNCLTVTELRKGQYRVVSEWTYDETRNVGVSTPVKRTSWAMNVACKPEIASIDTLKMYDAKGKEVRLSTAMRNRVVTGLQTNGVPPLVKQLCA